MRTLTYTRMCALAVALMMLAFTISLVPVVVLASDAIGPNDVEVGAPATTSFNPTNDGSFAVDGGAALGNLGVAPAVWAVALLAVVGALAWGVYRYSAGLP